MAVVYHPGKVRRAKLRRAVERARRRSGWDAVAWYATTEEDHGTGLARQAIADGATAVAAVGGDGTVRAVATALRGTGVPMALVPLGTGNLLVRNLGHPMKLGPALAVAFGDVERAIDVGVIRGTHPDGTRLPEEVFLVMAGVGIDAEMIRRTKPRLKRMFGWLAYADSVWRVLPSAQPFRLRFRVDDHDERDEEVHSLVIGNCGTIPLNLEVMPDWSIDDGILDVAGFRPRGPLGVSKVWWTVVVENGVLRRSRWGRRVSARRTEDDRDMIYDRGSRVAASADEPVGIQIDGDPYGDVLAMEAGIEPSALVIKTIE